MLSSLSWFWWARSPISTPEDLRLFFFLWKLLTEFYSFLINTAVAKSSKCQCSQKSYEKYTPVYEPFTTTPIWWIWEIWMADRIALGGGTNCCCRSDGSIRSEWLICELETTGLMSATAAPLCTSVSGIDDVWSPDRKGNYGLQECQVLQITIYIRV